jgi:hypothetical protein
MKSRLPLAALLAFLFVPVAYSPWLWRVARTGDGHSLWHLLTSVQFWLTLIGCIAVGIGLRRGHAFAWLGGLVGAAWLLYPRILVVTQAFPRLPLLPLGITVLMLVMFMVLLLTSPPRRFF